MKLSVKQLRKIIFEAMNEDAWMPNKWMPTSGEPVSKNDAEKLGEGDEDIDANQND